MSRYLDYKTTIWNRIEIPNNISIDEVIKELQETEPGGLSFIEDVGIMPMINTEEFIQVDENDGQCTIEIWEDNKYIWDNSYKTTVELCNNKSKA